MHAISSPVTVHEVAAWLDVRHPGWADMIDLTKLSMLNARMCIAGQLGLRWLELAADYQTDTGHHPVGLFAHPANRPAWVEEVLARRHFVPARPERELVPA